LLHADRIGDTLQFHRYAPLVAARGASVLLQLQRPLQRLVSGAFGSGVRIFAENDLLPPFELHSPLLSLPLAQGTTQNVPAKPPFLRLIQQPPRAGANGWAGRGTESRPRVGR
jgi:hypothetical protein